MNLEAYEVWFVTGSQNLYGEDVLERVSADAKIVAETLSQDDRMPVKIVFKPIVTTADAIRDVCTEANAALQCVGIITWMHTFSPAKMWIAGLSALRKPFAHLHTQFNRDIPWRAIDMDFMNLNQSAHGGREFGFIASRMRKARKVIVGHWQDPDVVKALAGWTRCACAWHDFTNARIARFGDNMREVAVTEGDKVEAQMQFGYAVNGYGIADLVEYVDAVTDKAVDALLQDYEDHYAVDDELRTGGERRSDLRIAARIEIGMRTFLEAGRFQAFTTNFETLHGLAQLPGLAVQRLMAEGYGFGAEGDWKTAALVRALKVMTAGLPGGASFMEDYTYHFEPGNTKVLGAHMLEICASTASAKPALQIHPLSIGGKDDPARLVFDVAPGPAVNASLIDLGHRFRLLVNAIDVVVPDQNLPCLPVARALWTPRPDLPTSAAAWILAGGAHHTAFSLAAKLEWLEDFAEMAGIECVCIDEDTHLRDFKKELRWNEAYYSMSGRN